MASQAVTITDNHQRLDQEFAYLADDEGEFTLDEKVENSGWPKANQIGRKLGRLRPSSPF